jgi:hypothetical protein
MKVLVACEFSGVVRDAFKAKGHDAWSCDLLPTERPGNHIQGDVLTALNGGWDMMIAHPPCTYLSNAGIRWFNIDKYGQKAVDRYALQKEALDFFRQLMRAPIEKICIENPVGKVSSAIRKPTQNVQPYYFGDPHIKRTCLWLKNLPPLVYDKTITPPEPLGITIRKPSKYYKGGEIKKHYFTQLAPTRGGHERSVTFQGIANAMADQWGSL